jgi:hypothetical protein
MSAPSGSDSLSNPANLRGLWGLRVFGSASGASIGETVSSTDHIEADAARIAERRGADTAALQWRERLVCSACGSHNVDMVVTGTERR